MKRNNLPDLKVGQVWQCREQKYRVAVTRKRPELEEGRQFYDTNVLDNANRRVDRYQFSVDVADETSYRGFEGSIHKFDLVQLLYDPNSEEVG